MNHCAQPQTYLLIGLKAAKIKSSGSSSSCSVNNYSLVGQAGKEVSMDFSAQGNDQPQDLSHISD
jgi:hypothetical protein